MKKGLIIFLIILSANNLFSQKEYYNWYFGEFAGITFNTPDISPIFLENSKMFGDEGCATISDSDGKLLFYSNGSNIWNGNHNIIEGGENLSGSTSSTQIMMIEQPGRSNLYCMITFTTIYSLDRKGLMLFTQIDASANNGAGKVINIDTIGLNYTEKVTAVYNSHGDFIWIATHKVYTNQFDIYSLTSNGLELFASQNIGSAHYTDGMTNSSGIGYMKFSPDGKKLALCLEKSQFIEIFDFDTDTGILKNPMKFSFANKTYGLEFSKDGSKLYFSGNHNIYQLDLNAGNEADIFNSTTKIFEDDYASFWAMQAGPDQKIYISNLGRDYLSVINKPNQKGDDCDFVLEGIDLQFNNSRLGLPGIPASAYFGMIDISANDICEGDTLFLETTITGMVPNDLTWSGPDNFYSKEQDPVIPGLSPNNEGWYVVSIVFKDSTYTDSIFVEVINIDAEIVSDRNFACTGDSIMLEVYTQETNCEYLWSTGETVETIKTTASGDYWVIVTKGSKCRDSVSKTVEFLPTPEPEISGDLLFCEGEETILSAGIDYDYYEWSTKENTKQITVNTPGTYWLKVISEDGCTGYDTVVTGYIDMNFEITPKNIDYGFVWLNEEAKADILISNNSPNEIEYAFNPNNVYFDISGYTGKIDAYGSEALTVSFSPDNLIDYSGNIEFFINKPCSGYSSVDLSGSGRVMLSVDIPDKEAHISEYICIPINAKLQANSQLNVAINYSAVIGLDAGILLTDIYGIIDGTERQIPLGANISVSNEQQKIAEICGKVMLGDRDYSLVDFIEFDIDNDRVEIDTSGGILSLKGLCARDLSRLTTFLPTRLQVSPNPADEEINLLIESEENGRFELKIYNLQGAEVYNTSWVNSGKTTKQININTNELSNGVYNLVLTNGTNAIRKNIFISK